MRTVICILLSFVIIISSTHTAGAAIIVPVTNSSTTPDSTTISDAVNGFKNLSKKEKKEKIKEVKKEIKANGDPSTNTLLLVILAILLPPLAVYLHQGVINNKFWISLILTLLFWLPGVIYALIVVLGKD